jgi:hypothetical protein
MINPDDSFSLNTHIFIWNQTVQSSNSKSVSFLNSHYDIVYVIQCHNVSPKYKIVSERMFQCTMQIVIWVISNKIIPNLKCLNITRVSNICLHSVRQFNPKSMLLYQDIVCFCHVMKNLFWDLTNDNVHWNIISAM